MNLVRAVLSNIRLQSLGLNFVMIFVFGQFFERSVGMRRKTCSDVCDNQLNALGFIEGVIQFILTALDICVEAVVTLTQQQVSATTKTNGVALVELLSLTELGLH